MHSWSLSIGLCVAGTSGLLAAAPAPTQTQTQTHQIPLTLQGKHPRVQVQIAGIARPLSFVVDTAAGATVLDLSVAEAAQVIDRAQHDNVIHGAGGSSAAPQRTRSLDLQTGSLALKASLMVTDLSALGGKAGTGINGILGNEILGRFDTRFDLPAGQLTLSPPGTLDTRGCIANALPDRPAMLQRFGIVQAQLQGDTGAPAEALAIIDTGAAQSVLNTAAVRALGLAEGDARLRPRATGTRGLGAASVPTWLYTLPSLRIGTWSHGAGEVRVSDLPVFKVMQLHTRPAVILGIDLLRDTPVQIPAGARLVCLGNGTT